MHGNSPSGLRPRARACIFHGLMLYVYYIHVQFGEHSLRLISRHRHVTVLTYIHDCLMQSGYIPIGWTREGVSGWETLVWLRTFMLAATSNRMTEPMRSCPTNGWPWRVSTMPSSRRKRMWWAYTAALSRAVLLIPSGLRPSGSSCSMQSSLVPIYTRPRI